MQATNILQDGYVETNISRTKAQVVAIATPAETDSGAIFELRLEFFPEHFQRIGIFDAVAQANVDFITGPNQYAWADVPGGQRARVYRTDASGGDGSVGIDTTAS